MSARMKIAPLLFVAALLSACATSNPGTTNAAAEIGISETEMAARLARQAEIGALQQRLASDPNFAGIYVEHTPTFRAVVQFTGADPGGQLARYTTDPLYVPAGAAVSYATLTATQQRFGQQLRDARIYAISSSVDVRRNRVVVNVVDEATTRREIAQQRLQIPDHVVFASQGGIVARAQSAGLIEHFPQRRYPDEELNAAIQGRLVLRDGCLRLGDGADSLLVIWPSFATLEGSGETYDIRYAGSGQVRAGRWVQMSGGQVDEIDQTFLTAPIPEQCAGPYWLAGSMLVQLN